MRAIISNIRPQKVRALDVELGNYAFNRTKGCWERITKIEGSLFFFKLFNDKNQKIKTLSLYDRCNVKILKNG